MRKAQDPHRLLSPHNYPYFKCEKHQLRKDLSAESKIKPRANKGKAVSSVQTNTHTKVLFKHTNAGWLESQGLGFAHDILYIIEKDFYTRAFPAHELTECNRQY